LENVKITTSRDDLEEKLQASQSSAESQVAAVQAKLDAKEEAYRELETAHEELKKAHEKTQANLRGAIEVVGHKKEGTRTHLFYLEIRDAQPCFGRPRWERQIAGQKVPQAQGRVRHPPDAVQGLGGGAQEPAGTACRAAAVCCPRFRDQAEPQPFDHEPACVPWIEENQLN